MSMASSAVIQRLEQRALMADELIDKLKQQVGQLKKHAEAQEAKCLTAGNAQLTQQVERMRQTLINLEIRNGLQQVALPASIANAKASNGPSQGAVANIEIQETPRATTEDNTEKKKEGGAKKEKKEKKEGKKQQQPAAEVVVDVSALDLRIGRITGVKRHPDADTLYVEEVELGEAEPRTVVSGLVKFIPIEQMQDRLVILCCNLKPAKMRGVTSQAMVMCASSPENVEILDPPTGSALGDRVSFQGYAMSETFPPQMNPKKKIFEKIQPDLKTDSNGVATYKGVPFEIQGKGVCTAPSMTNSAIK